MPTATMKDPKVVLDEAIDEAFAREHLETKPMLQRLGWPTMAIVASSALGVIATTAAVFVARRRTPLKPTFVLGKNVRRFGLRRYRLGHFGSAYIAYTYKLPQVRFALPRPIFSALPVKAR